MPKKQENNPKDLTEKDAYSMLGVLMRIQRIIDTPAPQNIKNSPEAIRAWDKLSAMIRETLRDGEKKYETN